MFGRILIPTGYEAKDSVDFHVKKGMRSKGTKERIEEPGGIAVV
jgi:hypothetical protein